ncbi:MAG: glycerol acyltransferase [Cytophagaceae bacterium SCN 52-12]|nr:MAG: glycerol acyltransferase [Cytophagaceae bacterium SCN 52-12]
MRFKSVIGRLLFGIAGWRLDIDVPVHAISKCVLIAAPHTSNWDFYYAIAAFWMMGVPVRFFIKDSWTKPWYGFVIRALGGIGVNRAQRSNLTGYAVQLLRERTDLYLVNSPEGTRAYTERWKTGFYHIAVEAEVPILLGYVDYRQKKGGIAKVVQHKGRSKEEVMQEIQAFYEDKVGRYPENYNPKIF